MAYDHSKYEVEMVPLMNAGPSVGGALWPTAAANGVQLSITGVRARWAPGFVPHIIKGAAIIVENVTVAMTDDVFVGFEADISVAGTPTRLFTINLPTSVLAHKSVFHRPSYYIEIKPGSIVDCTVTAAATAGVYGKVVLYVEPRWEEPANVTSMLAST